MLNQETTAAASEQNGAAASLFIAPEALRSFADSQVARQRETLVSLSAAFQNAYSRSIQNFNEYGKKVIEAGQQDAVDAFDCWRAMVGAKSPAEVVDVWARHVPRQLETMMSRAGALWSLSCNVSADNAKTVMNGVTPAGAGKP